MKKLTILTVLLALSFSAFSQNKILFSETYKSKSVKEASLKSPLYPPTNLTGYMVGDDLVLFWDSPTGGSGNGEWIHWDTGENNGNGIGLAGGDYFYVASRWTPSELAPFDGMSVTQMSFFPNGDVNSSYTLKIWTGENNACTEIMSQDVTSFTIDEFNIVNLVNPVYIDASLEYWFGYKVLNNWGYFPAGCDDGPAIQEYGDMISMDGTNWEGISGGYGLDYNWNIAIYIDNLKNTSPPQVISKSASTGSKGSFIANSMASGKTYTLNPPSTKDLIGYNVHINGDSVVFTIEPTYTIENIGYGTHEFCVTAVYDEGESECSNTYVLTGSNPLLPPTNFTGPSEVFFGEPFCFTWDAPGYGEWIHWDTGENTGNGIAAGSDFLVASRWMPSDLEPYQGYLLTKMAFFPIESPDAVFTFKVWKGPNAEIEVMSQDIQNFTVNSWNEVNLSNPVLIETSTEYWFGYAVSSTAGSFPAGCDDGPAIQGSGDLISIDGIEWVSMSEAYGFDFNWNLQAYLSYNGKTEKNKDLLYYNLYRNGELIGDTDCDIVYLPGLYTYCVTAVYDEGESVCSNEWIIDLTTGIDENELSNIQIFPNPASDVVNIKSDTKISNVKVYGFAGQIIMDKKADGKFYQINTTQFEAGIYLFRVETGEGVVSERIVVR